MPVAPATPGTIVLFGSGETTADGRRAHEVVMRRIPAPIRACVLETPAGFEPNSDRVAGRLAEFLRVRLQNFRPEVAVVPARRRGTPKSPDSHEVVAPLRTANYLMLGPGSPSYAVRQLRDSLAWQTLLVRHRLGIPLVLASAAAIAASAYALPVYEIYKVGEDPHWKPGLNLLDPFGLTAVFVPHWDNAEGGEELDTSRCFMGRARFQLLRAMLPPEAVVVGIDEHTALIVDFAENACRAVGRGGVTVLARGAERRLIGESIWTLDELGLTRRPDPAEGIPSTTWNWIQSAPPPAVPEQGPPAEVVALADARADARTRRDWPAADRLRAEIAQLGWKVNDAPGGYELVPSD